MGRECKDFKSTFIKNCQTIKSRIWSGNPA